MKSCDEKRQLLEELVEMHRSIEKKLETQDRMIKRFKELSAKGDLFVQIIDSFPYPIAVFLPDGMLKMANRALLSAASLCGDEGIVGTYNIFNHSDRIGLRISVAVKQALSGETVYLYDLNISRWGFRETVQTPDGSHPGCHSAVVFPIMEQDGKIDHVAIVLMNQK